MYPESEVSKMLNVFELAEIIQLDPVWDYDLCRDFCAAAGLESDWDSADGETFESVLYLAAEKLGVEI